MPSRRTDPSTDPPRRGLADLLGSDLTTSVYLALLQQPAATEAELVAASELDPEAVGLALAALEHGRLIRRNSQDAWAPLPPDRALSSYATRLEERARTVRATMTGLRRLHDATIAAQHSDEVPLGVHLLRTLDEIHRAMDGLFAGSQQRVVSMRRGSPRVLHLLEQTVEFHEQPVFNGEGQELSLRVTFDTGLLQHPRLHEAVEARARAGDEIRFYRNVPFTATVSDEGTCVVDVDNPDGSIFGLHITHPGVSAAIERVIDGTWELGVPWRGGADPSTAAPPTLSTRDHDILALLTTGAADATIARQLGISQRTVERRVSRMMDLLGSTTRFQAGVQATRRGWV